MTLQDFLKIAHGCLMTVSWGIFIVTGVLFARHFRGYETTYCGVKIWFSMHRALNTAGLVGIALSTICIIIAQGRWEGPWFGMESMGPGTWHSLIGSLAITLAISQPINALFRCKEGTKKRKKFTWSHRIIGILSFFLAMMAMLIATTYFTKMFANPVIAMCIWIAYLIILFVCMTLKALVTWQEWKKNKTAPVDKIVFESDCAKKAKHIVLIVFLFFAFDLSIALCVLMILKPAMN